MTDPSPATSTDAAAVLDEVRARRRDLANVLTNPEYAGIRQIVEDLYPDRAHFIYELLQNAEDVGAHTARFTLADDRLAFAHFGGRPFEKRDVEGITNIGQSAKKSDEETIGRFGLGFKAVFAYSETPHVYSGSYAFRITSLVLPEAVDAQKLAQSETRFDFPFNNPKKAAETARSEIERGLFDLSNTTLLFLRNLRRIMWRGADGRSNSIERIEHGTNLLEIQTLADGSITARSYFLRFTEPAPHLPHHVVALVFPLSRTSDDDTALDVARSLAEQLRIVPEPGRVSVYFPAEKETSNLRFHVHAPFVPELSRASVKETPANAAFFDALAMLAAAALPVIRDLGLLTREFLEVLPNRIEALPKRYEVILDAIITAMVEESLTPTHDGGHLPARRLLQARGIVKELLDADDLSILIQDVAEPCAWAVAPTQRNSNTDRFLTALAIRPWEVNELAATLNVGTYAAINERLVPWLAEKSVEWHQRLYAMLNEDPLASHRWAASKIVLLDTGEHATPGNCYFPQGDHRDSVGPRVNAAVYTSGKSTQQQDAARNFLERIGVHEMGEAEEIARVLHDRYRSPADDLDLEIHFGDIRRFMAFVAEKPQSDLGFLTHEIFRTTEGSWAAPKDLYLDAPYRETHLAAFYGEGTGPTKRRITSAYLDAGFAAEAFAGFAERIGVQTRLSPTGIGCDKNPQKVYLYSVPGERYRNSVNRDWEISGLAERMQTASLPLSKLVWRTMRQLRTEHLEARYQKNERSGPRLAASQIVHLVRSTPWVPQGDDRFVIPADAARSLLPPGLPFDEGERWLKAIDFGLHEVEASRNQAEEQAWASRLGFSDREQLDRARRFIAIPPDEQQRVLFEWERRQSVELPERTSPNPARRAAFIQAAATEAPERASMTVERAVAVGLAEVKEAAELYLRNQYTNDDNIMICQMCHDELPFRRSDGAYYFEKVSFIPDLDQRHHQNYLALCPNHGAMFQYANPSRDSLKATFLEMSGRELTITVADAIRTLYFTDVHRDDLRAVLGGSTKLMQNDLAS
jgi:hypothetical protein